MMAQIAEDHARLRMAELALGLTAACFVIATVGGLAWMMFLDTKPPFSNHVVQTKNIHGEPQTVFRAGETMRVGRDLCFDRDAPVTFGRSLSCKDATGREFHVSLNTTSGMMRAGCVSNDNILRIPDNTPPGVCKFVNVVQYSNNSFHSGVTTLPAPVIEIVK